MTTSADVAVVGTGVLGLATALDLLDAGLRVAVVGPLAGAHQGQASRAAGAMLTVFSEVEAGQPTDRVLMEVAERTRARDGYEAWLDRIASAAKQPGALSPGVWVIANGIGRDDGAELTAIATAARQFGHRAERVAASEVVGLSPHARAFEALWLPSEASVDTGQLMSALTVAVAGHELCQWVDGPATAIREHGAGVAVDSAAEQVEAAHLVLAAGVRIPALLATSGGLNEDAALPGLWSGRGVSLTVQTRFELPAAIRTPNRGFACGAHLVPRGADTMYLGATNRFSTQPDLDRRPSLDEVATLIHDGARELNVGLRQAKLLEARTGHRPVTADHLPLIGRTWHDRVYVATGTYRCGVLLARRAAHLITREILNPGNGQHPYSPRRTITAPDPLDLTADHAAALVELIQQPGGHLPPGADRQLETVIRAALTELLAGDSRRSAAVRRVWERAPVAECLPLLLDIVGRPV